MPTAVESNTGTLLQVPETQARRRFALHLSWPVALVSACVFVVCGHMLLKAGVMIVAKNPGHTAMAHLLAFATTPAIVGGLAVYGLGSMFWIIAVAQTEVSMLYPLSSFNYVLIVILGRLVFHEQLSVMRALGVLTIMGGMVLLARDRGNKQ